MSVVAGLTAATTLMNVASDVINGRGPIVDGAKALKNITGSELAKRTGSMVLRSGGTNVSLAQYTAQTAIRTKAFIDQRVAAEDVLPNLLRALRSYYLAQVLTALQLQQLVSRGVSVQDVLSVVQTGAPPHFNNAVTGAFKRLSGLESLECQLDVPGKAEQLGTEALGTIALGLLSTVGPDVATFLLKKGIAQFTVNKRPTVTATPVDKKVKDMTPQEKAVFKEWEAQNKAVNKWDDDFSKLKYQAVEYTVGKFVEEAGKKLTATQLDKLKAELAKAKTQDDLNKIATKYGIDGKLLETEIQAFEKKIGLDKAKYDADMRNTVAGPSTMDVRDVSLEELNNIAVGEMKLITLTNPEHPERSVQVPIIVQMIPLVVPAKTMPRLIDRQMTPALWQRLIQRSTGEISFWSDFIGQADLLRRQSMPKDPESIRVLREFNRTIAKKDAYSRSDITSSRSENAMSKNLPNTVLVFSEEAVNEALADSGIDLHNDADRARYFHETYTMIIAILDPAFHKVTIYINGVDGPITASYTDFKPKTKNFDPTDLLASMAALSQGRRPPL